MENQEKVLQIFLKKNKRLFQEENNNEFDQKIVLYSLFTVVVLSKNIFPRNIDIKEFLASIDIEFKAYVYSSRTQIISRIIRVIQNSDKSWRQKSLTSITEILEKFDSIDKKNPPKPLSIKNNKNSVDEILNIFGRK